MPAPPSLEATTVLYRPVGTAELALLRELHFRAFPPRLPEQPIFYPVLSREHAEQIARDWNARHSEDRCGYVTRFRVRTAWLARHEVRTVGASEHREYWIPAEELAGFNDSIVGPIEVIAEFHGEGDGPP